MITADTITDDEIRELFARHCECRPIDIERTSHSHDCDAEIAEACRTALGGAPLWPDCMREARGICAHILNGSRRTQ